MALVDVSYTFTIIDVRGYGKSSDGGLLTRSILGKSLKVNTLNILNHRLTRHDMCKLAFSGSSMRLAVSSDCPQEGVLSPLLHCLVVDDSIARLNGGDTHNKVTLMTFVF